MALYKASLADLLGFLIRNKTVYLAAGIAFEKIVLFFSLRSPELGKRMTDTVFRN